MPNFGNTEEGFREPKSNRPGGKNYERTSEAYGKDLEKAWQAEDRYELEERLKRIAPPAVTEKRCHVCTHPHREWIEHQLVMGKSYSAIARAVEHVKKVDRRSIGLHYEKHMALDQAAVRAIMEEQADLIGQSYQEGVKGAITKRGVLELAMRKALEDMQQGLTTVEMKDAIQIIKLLNDMDSEATTEAVEEAKMSIAIFLQAIRDVCDEETLRAVGERVQYLRKDQGIAGEIERGVEAPIPEVEVVDAESVPSA